MATLASMTVRLGIDTDQLREGVESAKRSLAGLGKGLAGLGIGVPVAAAVAAGVGGMAAAFASAGAAAKAFQLAAGKQMEAVAEVTDLAAEAQKAAAEGAADAAKKQQAYTDALGRLPAATQATAREMVGLKSDFQAWSDSLSGSTMPVFTKGIQILRGLLPSLTPLVKAASNAFSDFLDGIKGDQGSISAFIKDLAGSAEENLGSFLRTFKNIGVGVAGVISAFLPLSGDMAGGMEEASAAFARWGRSLKGSAGFADFLDLAKQGGETLTTLGETFVTLLVAVGPLVGVTSELALVLAEVINAVPTPALTVLAGVIAALTIGMKAWAVAQAIVALHNRIWTTSQWSLNASLFASPITWIILAIVALIAIIVLIAVKTDWFQKLWQIVWAAVKVAFWATVKAVLTAAGWLAALPGRIAGWIGQAKNRAIALLAALVRWVAGLPGRFVQALASLGSRLWGVARRAIDFHNRAVRGGLTAAVSLVRSLPGRAAAALGNLGNRLRGAGQALIRGFINGIKSMLGAVGDAAGSVVSKARRFFPFSPAKEGPFSGRGYTTYSGAALIGGFIKGIEGEAPGLRDTLAHLPGLDATINPPGVRSARTGVEPVPVVIDVQGADEDLVRLFRRIVRVRGRGNVQTALGR